jgi:hypothetical protein
MTFSHKIGLYDVQGPIPVVKNVFIPPDSEEDGPPVALEDAMPLLSFLAPVCYITMIQNLFHWLQVLKSSWNSSRAIASFTGWFSQSQDNV